MRMLQVSVFSKVLDPNLKLESKMVSIIGRDNLAVAVAAC